MTTSGAEGLKYDCVDRVLFYVNTIKHKISSVIRSSNF